MIVSAPWFTLPAMRLTGAATPVEVSFCAQQYASTPSVSSGRRQVPKSPSYMAGSSRNGAEESEAAIFFVNEPYTPHAALRLTSEQHTTSQNALAPPLPSTTS